MIGLYAGESLPQNFNSVRAVISMGGPMNVYEEEKYPFLKDENYFIQKTVQAKVPFLGICLGAQLLAKALGARVHKATEPEIGWCTIDLTTQGAKDTLFAGLKENRLRVLQWHEDTFDLPKGSVLLASTVAVLHQAYAAQGLFYGFQFHVEVNRPILENWFKDHELKDRMLSEYDFYRNKLDDMAKALYRNFFQLRK